MQLNWILDSTAEKSLHVIVHLYKVTEPAFCEVVYMYIFVVNLSQLEAILMYSEYFRSD